jgi:hypothetical protein
VLSDSGFSGLHGGFGGLGQIGHVVQLSALLIGLRART